MLLLMSPTIENWKKVENSTTIMYFGEISTCNMGVGFQMEFSLILKFLFELVCDGNNTKSHLAT